MNFIIKLSKLEKLVTEIIYDSILMIIDRLIKYSHLISFKESYSIDQPGFIVLNRLIQYHDILKKVTSIGTSSLLQIIERLLYYY